MFYKEVYQYAQNQESGLTIFIEDFRKQYNLVAVTRQTKDWILQGGNDNRLNIVIWFMSVVQNVLTGQNDGCGRLPRLRGFAEQ